MRIRGLGRLKRFLGLERPTVHIEGADQWQIGKSQFDYLVSKGLQPHHKLLDLPCGSFRAGRHLIEYLHAGCYHGLEGNGDHIKAGVEHVLKPAGLTAKDPKLATLWLDSKPPNVVKLTGCNSFDFIWVHALFDHIPHDTIKACLIGCSEALAPNGVIYATIFLNPHGESFREPMLRPRNGTLERAVVTFPDREYWHHTYEFFQGLMPSIPKLMLEPLLYDYEHQLGLRMLQFVRSDS